MIDLYFWTTPNGYKPLIFLEETETPYEIKPVNISKGDQFEPEFLTISPNNRIPAMVDHAPADGDGPLALFESGAILQYLAEKTGRFLPEGDRGRFGVMQWLFWQMAGLGPMLGQNHHFKQYAPEPLPYAIERYEHETERLYGVLDDRLTDRPFVASDYSIADIACYPWIVPYERQGIKLEDFPNLKRWFERIAGRPAVQGLRQGPQGQRGGDRQRGVEGNPVRPASPQGRLRGVWFTSTTNRWRRTSRSACPRSTKGTTRCGQWSAPVC